MAKRKGVRTNLDVLTSKGRKPDTGDIFVLRPAGHPYYFGRVMNPDLRLLTITGKRGWEVVLVYIYATTSRDKSPVPPFDCSRLLLPPQLLDPACWEEGYLEVVGSAPLTRSDMLPRHVFLHVHDDSYVDEHGHPADEPREGELCGVYGLTPFYGLDNKISRALGIPEIKGMG